MPTTFNRTLAVLGFAMLSAGCANIAAIPPGTPSAQVQAKAGAPKAVWKNGDGSETWEYSRVPYGVQTYMVSFNPDRTVREVHQVLSQEFFTKSLQGLSHDAIQRTFGTPGEISYFPSRDEEVWSWRFLGGGGEGMYFNVHFDRSSGTVRTVSQTPEFRSDHDD